MITTSHGSTEPKPETSTPKPEGRDRRVFDRADAAINCKLRRDARASFSPGRTSNISAGGACVDLIGPRLVSIGERVAVAFEHATCPVTRSAGMITATIVRAEPAFDNRQRVALAFDHPQFGLKALEVTAAA
jgi:hypothetical protein